MRPTNLVKRAETTHGITLPNGKSMYVREWAGLYDIYVGYAGDRALVERSQGIKRKSVRQATARIWDAAALEAATQSAGSTSLAAGGMS